MQKCLNPIITRIGYPNLSLEIALDYISFISKVIMNQLNVPYF
ncbi:hypothetical protein PMIT1327_00271 [Prochlorococcus marinus str. MIT 1327]|nr:hypothetical protein PMIT1312_00463 [Prochlorococcus marinus str. MIT 1312]KZR83934.1 hypothetical protein PMIT1327_00271 [Prochlorococcus marinus str. MIT 1327]